MDVLLQDTWDELLISNFPERFFRKEGDFVQVDLSNPDTPRIGKLSRSELSYALIQMVDWVRGKVATMPPQALLTIMLENPSDKLPELSTLITVSSFTNSGTLIKQRGYDADNSVYYAPTCSGATIGLPTAPTASELAAARDYILNDFLGEFSFAADSDRAHAVAGLLVPFVKLLLRENLMPGILVKAANPGAGKTTLCNVINIVATGLPCEVMTLGSGEDEIRKRILSALRQGHHSVLFDNLPVQKTVNSAALATLLTSNAYKDRVLGTSNVLQIRNETLVLLTGNNPQLTPELLRRTIPISLLSPSDWRERTFERLDIQVWTHDNRRQIIRALLTMIQAWVADGLPNFSGKPLPTYGRWCEVMGGVLETAGIPGFLSGLDSYYDENNIQEAELEQLFEVWHAELGTGKMRVKHVLPLCEKHKLLRDVRGTGATRSQSTLLGNYLKDRGGRRCGVWELRVTLDGSSNAYTVAKVENDEE